MGIFLTIYHLFIIIIIYFIILYWFCRTSTWIHHGYTRVPHPEHPPTCIISYKKWITSPASMQNTVCLGLVHWEVMYISYKNLWWDNFILYYNFKGAELLIVSAAISRARRYISQQKFNNSIANLGVSKSPKWLSDWTTAV